MSSPTSMESLNPNKTKEQVAWAWDIYRTHNTRIDGFNYPKIPSSFQNMSVCRALYKHPPIGSDPTVVRRYVDSNTYVPSAEFRYLYDRKYSPAAMAQVIERVVFGLKLVGYPLLEKRGDVLCATVYDTNDELVRAEQFEKIQSATSNYDNFMQFVNSAHATQTATDWNVTRVMTDAIFAGEAANTKAAEPEQVPMAGGQVLSTRIPPYHLIPTAALDALANRLAEGLRLKREQSWNAIANNQEVLKNLEFLIDRLGHIARHTMLLRDKLHRRDFDAIVADDDAGAILFGGTLLTCAIDALLAEHAAAGGK